MAVTDGSGLADFADLCNTPVTRYRRSARDAYGQPTYPVSGDVVSVHLFMGAPKDYDVQGQGAFVTATIYSPSILGVDPDTDVIELPDGSRPRIVNAMIRYDEDGRAHHEVIMLGDDRG